MGNHKASGILLSASQRMRMAVEQERLKPQYAFEQPDAQTFLLASAVKQNPFYEFSGISDWRFSFVFTLPLTRFTGVF